MKPRQRIGSARNGASNNPRIPGLTKITTFFDPFSILFHREYISLRENEKLEIIIISLLFFFLYSVSGVSRILKKKKKNEITGVNILILIRNFVKQSLDWILIS